ncbi:hypothetical protein [Nonomuraea sp. NPDC049400]|uniref:hypothetical protein n=1 Tax=Nonomuraea sp. NPDC049400 TaxID=3364352 RepID=UPI00379B5512
MPGRLFNPAAGRFLQVDPVEGGGDNAYGYSVDPISQAGLDGHIWGWVKKAANTAVKYVKKNPLDAALVAAGFVPGLGAAAMAVRGVRAAIGAVKILRAVRAARGAGMAGGVGATRAASRVAG